MIIENLHVQIQRLVEYYCGGNLTAFARSIGAPQSTLQRVLPSGDVDKLLRFVPKILTAYPSVREHWLYTGDGEMLYTDRPMEIRTAVNCHGNLVGDILFEVFRSANIDIDDIPGVCHINCEVFEQVMESSRYPDWDMLQKFNYVFGININYLFSESGVMFVPLTEFDRAIAALCADLSRDRSVVMSAVGAELHDFDRYIALIRKFKADRIEFMRLHGTIADVFDGERGDYIEAPSDPGLPAEWVDRLAKNHNISPAFIRGRSAYPYLPIGK